MSESSLYNTILYKAIRQTFHLGSLPLFIGTLSFICLSLFASCTEPTREELAAEAAKTYYEHLIAGRDAEYVAGLYGSDTIREEYRRQLCDNARMFMDIQKKKRNGIVSVRTMRTEADSTRHSINVFLMLCFGDSINEQVVVPMMEHDGRWVMR